MQLLFIVLLGFITIFQSYSFYFYRDDFALLYNLQHNIAFNYPYWFLNYLYLPIFLLSKTQPVGYFIYNSIFYFCSIIIFFFFVKELFTKKLFVFLATIISTISPVGIVSLEWMSLGSLQYFSLCLLLLTLLFYLKFQKKNNLFFGFAAGVFFILSLELVPLRAFSFIVPLSLLEIIRFKKRAIKISVLRLLPFLLIFFAYYLIQAPLMPNGIKNEQVFGASQITTNFKTSLAWYAPFQTTITVLYGGITIFLTPDGSLDEVKYKLFLILAMIIFITIASFFVYKKNKQIFFLIVASLVWMYLHILGYNLVNQPGDGEVVARYNTFLIPAFAIFWSSTILGLYLYIKETKIKILYFCSIFIFLIINIWSTIYFLSIINTNRNRYAKIFYKQLKTVIPTLPNKNLLFYMKSSNLDSHFKLIDFTRVGIYDKNASIAAIYDINQENIVLLINSDELTDYLSKNNMPSLIYAISYDGKSVRNISEQIKEDISIYSKPASN